MQAQNGSDDDDRTIRIVRPPKYQPRLSVLLLGLTALLAAGIVAFSLLRPAAVVVQPPAQTARGLDAPLADAATILNARAADLLLFRYRDAPAILVLSFPSLAQQGDMLDRVAALVEKAGLPRDRVLGDAELDAAIRQAGDTRATYYSGHDYRAADIARFFVMADRDGIVLNPQEVRLRALLKQAGWLTSNVVGALISIPPVTETEQIDDTARATILHHELSHGVYFTDPAYAEYARNFWLRILNDTQRSGFRRFLGSEGYDTANEDLMLNEAQAFLIHTTDPRYFVPDRAGLTMQQAASLREQFVRGMPDGWLKAAAERGQ